MNKSILLLLMAVLTSIAAPAQNADERAIRQMLGQQVSDWNRGDLDAFMRGYWNSDSLMFLNKKGVTYGYQQTLELYKKGYGDTARMGQFTSTILKMQPLAKDCYMVVGRYDLKRSVGDAIGHYSLLVRKIKGRWLIVFDHSS